MHKFIDLMFFELPTHSNHQYQYLRIGKLAYLLFNYLFLQVYLCIKGIHENENIKA